MHLTDLLQYEKKYRKINQFLLTIMGIIAVCCVAMGLDRGDSYAAFQALLALWMFTLPALITRYGHFSIPQDFRLLYYIFTFSTIVVGSAMYGYSRIPHWDKLFHFFSGILISAVGLILCHLQFHTLSGDKKARCVLYLIVPFIFNLSVAALWEIYEYMLYIFLDIDAVNNMTTGVNDTMQDMIVCAVGGIFFSISLLRAYLKKKCGFILKVCQHFFQFRGQELEL